ncbi:protein-transporting protein SEC63 KNAG_0J01840 [Huiozyma naganishii CBS 8797]|uniref:J domain-containing protein n=1 Tax=Huiozyma naganishii (strain ATCC MYA-139 / BCRC 22969 / CBS 8797 / KCTC 17520 / NBRC 10181 / NCYC 3082 / Yp74L-3) TaxID=1071383 RepID=J7RBK4_HUIN7|nr:hypothetical protein KNAG_0J01840 [Kazachstania naganishii CBS 8797]CCK72265.1 hypothetical protein KNAG_0J01840 [Kazachstania naganishii CBS 8797]
MALSYDYDESSETWPFFLLTILLVSLVPLTAVEVYHLVWAPSGEDSRGGKAADGGQLLASLNDEFTESEIVRFRKKFQRKRSVLFKKRTLLLVSGWILVAYLVQRIGASDAIRESAKIMFDPYELLGISSSASDKDIKSAYRKLSLKFHPDKLPKGLSEADREGLEAQYVQITKAYESLTDELIRFNYLTYGHPDGPQSETHGIALPSFLVDATSSPIIVTLYILSFVLVLPVIVSKWWSKTQSYTKKGIATKTASYFVDRLVNHKPSEIVTVALILKWLSHAEEFKQFYPNLDAATFEKLLNDHLNRRDSGDQNEIKYRIVAKCHSLLYGLLDVSTGFRNVEVATVTLDTFKCIVQAVPHVTDGEILQLPNVNKAEYKKSDANVHTLGKLFTLDETKIGGTLGITDSTHLKQAIQVASNIPFLRLLKADFIVPGEEYVTPMAVCYISLKVLVRSAKHKIITTEKFPSERFEESQDFEDMKDPYARASKQPIMPYSFAPKFPVKRRNAWCCLVVTQKDNKIIQSPFVVERFSLKNLSNEFDKLKVKDLDAEFNPEDWEIGTINIPLGTQAPPANGKYFFRVIVKSTDYFGSDIDITMTMNVRDPPKLEVADDVYDASDSENDDDDENDDESDSNYTDIDTDTEVEEDATG